LMDASPHHSAIESHDQIIRFRFARQRLPPACISFSSTESPLVHPQKKIITRWPVVSCNFIDYLRSLEVTSPCLFHIRFRAPLLALPTRKRPCSLPLHPCRIFMHNASMARLPEGHCHPSSFLPRPPPMIVCMWSTLRSNAVNRISLLLTREWRSSYTKASMHDP